MGVSEISIEGLGEGARLDGTDSHHANAALLGEGDGFAGREWLIEASECSARIEQVRDALDDGGPIFVTEDGTDGGRPTDSRDSPGGGSTFLDDAFEGGSDGFSEEGEWRTTLAAGAVRDDVAVEDEDIDVIELHALETLGETVREAVVDLRGRRVTELDLGGDPHCVRQFAFECLADHTLGFAITVTGGEIKKRDSGLDGLACGGDRFGSGGFAPDGADAATPERE